MVLHQQLEPNLDTLYPQANKAGLTGPPVPSVPTGLEAQITDGAIALTWTAPVNDGGSPITDYTIEYKASASNDWIATAEGVSLLTAMLISQLVNETNYDFRVAAVNANGQGPFTEPVTAAPFLFTAPSAPQHLTAIVPPSSTAITLVWNAPEDNGGSVVIDHLLQYKRTVDAAWTNASTPESNGASVNFGNDSYGVSYDFRVRARNIHGFGDWSNTAQVTPLPLPDQPLGLTNTAFFSRVIIDWNEPIANTQNDAITSYQILRRHVGVDSGFVIIIDNTGNTDTAYTDEGLDSNTRYVYRVKARNRVGLSPQSAFTRADTLAVDTSSLLFEDDTMARFEDDTNINFE